MQPRQRISESSWDMDGAASCPTTGRRRTLRFRTLLFVVPTLLVLVLGKPVATLAEESEDTASDGPVPTRVDVIGNATINWHLAPAQPSARATALIERYRNVTAAHLTGDKPPTPEQPEPALNRDGIPVHSIPAELIPTMFLNPEGETYCSDGTVPSPYSAQDHEKEGN